MRITIREVATRSGVSQSTVSKALNGSAGTAIPPETCRRIQRIAADLGYQPNTIARSLGRRRTDTIGLMIGGLKNPFYVGLLESAELRASQVGYQVLLENGLSVGGTFVEHSKLRGWPVDGVLIWAYPSQSLEDYLGPQAREMPVVYLGYIRNDQTDWVAFDLYGGGRQIAEHLAQQGYRRIAYASPYDFSDGLWSDPRGQAYHEVCREANMTLETILLKDGAETRTVGLNTGLEIAARPATSRPEAVICHNDVVAVGVYHGLRRAGLRIPQDIAVVGFDGTEEGQCLDYPLTTVLTSAEEMSEQALCLLKRRLDKDAPGSPQQILLPTTLIVGGTTKSGSA